MIISQSRAGFLDLGTIHILGQIILCCGGISYVLQDGQTHPWSPSNRCQEHPSPYNCDSQKWQLY